MTKPALTAAERQKWFEMKGALSDEEPSTPAEAFALRDYLDGQITAYEAGLRLFDGRDEYLGYAPNTNKLWRVIALLIDAIQDIREQHEELFRLVQTIPTISPDDLRLTAEQKILCPEHIEWPKLYTFGPHLDDSYRLYDLEEFRYNHYEDDDNDAWQADEHPLSNARRYVSLAEWRSRDLADEGYTHYSIAPMKLALETELVTEEWPIMNYRKQDPNDPYTAYDVEIPMVSAVLKHMAHLMFTAPGTYIEEEYKTFYKQPTGKGELWHGRSGWSYERWTFWKQRLRWVIESDECRAKSDTRGTAKAALARMEEVERDNTEK